MIVECRTRRIGNIHPDHSARPRNLSHRIRNPSMWYAK